MAFLFLTAFSDKAINYTGTQKYMEVVGGVPGGLLPLSLAMDITCGLMILVGYKTNWAFPNNLSGGNPKTVAEAVSHEDGHALGLSHQARWSGGVLQSDYDDGTSTGNAIAPIMGVAYSTTRGVWRIGATSSNSSPTAQNDLRVLQLNAGIQVANSTGFIDAGIGRSFATATPLPLTGTSINSLLAKGVITPLSSTNPNPIGESNYTSDFFTFSVSAGAPKNLNVTLLSGRSTITAGVADPGATLNATLRLLDAFGVEMAVSNTGVLSESITFNNLTEGTYYLKISSAGGFTDINGYGYFDLGSYTVIGTFAPVPEPTTILSLAGVSFIAIGWNRRRRANRNYTNSNILSA